MENNKENNIENKESPKEIPNKEQGDIKVSEDQKKLETIPTKEKELKMENEIKNEIKEENNIKENENKVDTEKNQTNVTEKQTKDEKIDPHLIFQKELLTIIKKQQQILTSTSTINEKFGVSNEITKEQIATFKINIDKYGKYLIMIKKELGMISDTMRKIKKLSKEKDITTQK